MRCWWFESYSGQDFFYVHLFHVPRSWTGNVQMKPSMTFIQGDMCIERENDNFKSCEVTRLKDCALALLDIYTFVDAICLLQMYWERYKSFLSHLTGIRLIKYFRYRSKCLFYICGDVLCIHCNAPVGTRGFKSGMCPPYPHACRKRRLKWGAVI